MGFRFRRTFKIIPGVRLNLSRSGPSVSLGPRGLRYTLGLKGSRVTAGIPGSGLSWTAYQPYSAGSRSDQAPARSVVSNGKLRDATVEPPPEKPNAELLETSPVEDLVAGSTSELAPLLNSARNRLLIQLVVLALITSLFVLAIAYNSPPASVAAAVLGLIIWSAAALFDQHRLTVTLEYNLQDNQSQPFNELVKAFQGLMDCRRTWRIPVQSGQSDPKRNAGAAFTVGREQISISTGTPKLIKSNVAFLCFPLGNKTLYFAPDAILVISGRSVAALRYDDLAVSATSTKFIEDERPPDDAQVIGETWQYVNKDGTPDRRFVNNRRLPICIYGELDFESSTGINECVHCSHLEAAKTFAACAVAMRHTNAELAKPARDAPMNPTQPIGRPTKSQSSGENLDPAVAFAKELEKARTLALEHGKFWEYLLIEELLKSKLPVLKSEYDAFEKTLRSIPARRFSGPEFLSWLSDKTKELASTNSKIMSYINEELPAALGKPGVSGDAIRMLRAVDARAMRGSW